MSGSQSGFTIIFWRDIPTQIVMGRGRKARKQQLSDRFMVAVDKAAMAAGLATTDAYLAQWRKVPFRPENPAVPPRMDDIARKLEQDYPTSRLAELARNGGLEKN